jgi:hypothetical protein
MKEDIIKTAQEAGIYVTRPDEFQNICIDDLERFAALVADRCAEIAYEAEPYQAADLIRKAFGVDK